MTETERKALALMNEVREEEGLPPLNETYVEFDTIDRVALCRAIERHEALEAEVERLRVECEFIASVTSSPLINPLETGFRHSPLTQRERETRYMEACALAYQSARAAIEKRGGKIVWGEGA